MKRNLFVSLVVIAVLAMGASSAFAYVSDIGWSAGVNGNGAHGTYATTTNVCKSCHDVHGAQKPGTASSGTYGKLYRWDSVGEGCNYCHMGTTAATDVRVYDQVSSEASHAIGATVLPDSTSEAGIGLNAVLDCFDCHNAAPHGVVAATDVRATANLIAGYNLATDAGINAYCGTMCHDKNDAVAPDAASTHSMQAAPGVTLAITNSSSCVDCHTSRTSTNEDFPHMDTNDYAFLGDAVATSSALDKKCISCHLWNGNNTGVGTTY